MKKLVLGAGAFLLSSSAMAGTVHANTMPWAMNPTLQSAVVDAGMNHVHPATTSWMGDAQDGKSLWADKGVSAAYGEFDGAMAPEATLAAGGKNASLTTAQLGEKQSWLSQSAGSSMGGKNEALTAEQMGEKQMWLAQNEGGDSNMASAGKTADYNGQGGPDESAEAGGETVWPACRPGAGDDRCIQLYERGVSRAYAQWSAGRSRMGMGGPEEPVSGKDAMASTTSDMSMATKGESATGPTTQPTGVRAEGKTAMSMG